MLEYEQAFLMPMPAPFDSYVESQHKISSPCLVAVASNRYPVPCELAGQPVCARLYPQRVGLAKGDTIIASHLRLVNSGQVQYDWRHYIPLIERKSGALHNGAPFADLPAPLQRLRQGLLKREGDDRVMAWVLACASGAR